MPTERPAYEPHHWDWKNNMTNPLANPSPLGFAGFATTLMTLSLSMMGVRGVENEGIFIANLLLLAGLGLVISAQWEMVRGNTFPYTVLSAFGFYYAGYGIMLLPPLGIIDSYGGRTSEYYNAFGLYLGVWSGLNLVFFIASLRTNVANVIVYGALELCYVLNAVSKFTMADGNLPLARILTKVAGAFGAISALSGFYLLFQGLWEGCYGGTASTRWS
ncbi:GPR1/FUN34/yaaH family-domain-containing protein [Plectosphaerella cucumerina]|uniref:GPR1/FUN34/yaaH family-domain-containing protein n=1 Tax=Plectosphaerella cucumerina TaxID=40658 RepID=A0A8K0WYZ5_9PEZI|nr:GPR1/FUN34/yaaH family-domain-containing protein [Plectosphaerella cucumerina]